VDGQLSLGKGAGGRTSAVAAVRHAAGRPVVACTYDALLPHNHAAYAALHAVAAVRGQVRQLHEVLVPAWAEARLVREVQRCQRGVEGWHRGGGVQQLELGALEQNLEAGACCK
jgi:hypothetical protein